MSKEVHASPTKDINSMSKRSVIHTTQSLDKADLDTDSGAHYIQTKLKIGAVDDPLEKEADDMADQVMRMPETSVIQRKCAECEEEDKIDRKPLSTEIKPFVQRKVSQNATTNSDVSNQINTSRGKGSPLPSAAKGFMENRFGADFSNVNIHTGSKAQELSHNLNARAFTVGNDIFFNSGQFSPESTTGKHLLAHELTHVIQQGKNANNLVQRSITWRAPSFAPSSGFGRAQDMIDRMNNLAPQPRPMTYRLNGNTLEYVLVDEPNLTNFDTQMRAFIDDGVDVPMILVNSHARSRRPRAPAAAPLNLVGVDDFDRGYVDVEDMLASDDVGFQLNMVHFLAERFRTTRYAQRIGTVMSDATFNRSHRAGLNAEVTLLRSMFNDQSIRFSGQYDVGAKTLFQFRSLDEGYKVFQEFRFGRRVSGGNSFVIPSGGGTRQTVEAFLAARAAAAGP